MKRGWHSVLTKVRQEQDDSDSFIGGKPCIPLGVELPVCKICGEPLTFFFQVAFPKGHMWAGKSLAFFFCSATYHKHQAKQWFPPELVGADPLDAGALAPERYQTLFKVIFFDTKNGVLREDYEEKVVYQRIDWKSGIRKNKSTPIVLSGEPIWMESFGKEYPAAYEGKKMNLVLQVAQYFNFEKYPDAPPEMKKNYTVGGDPFRPRKENDYTLFCDFNRVFLWGTEEDESPVFGINVQSDI